MAENHDEAKSMYKKKKNLSDKGSKLSSRLYELCAVKTWAALRGKGPLCPESLSYQKKGGWV